MRRPEVLEERIAHRVECCHANKIR
jgi:hypothetical protein